MNRKHHLPAGTRVQLTCDQTEDEHAATDIVIPKGWPGVLVDEDGYIAFHPDQYPKGWGFFLAPTDYQLEISILDMVDEHWPSERDF